MQQRGTTRRRSPSDTGEQDHSLERPPQRHRPSSDLTSMTAHSTLTAAESTSRSMGAPLPFNGVEGNGLSGNGASGNGSTGNGADNGPYTLPTSFLEQVRTYRPEGALMYQDDEDWEPVPEDISMDAVIPDADGNSEADRAQASRKQVGKRMPVDREEIVRLMLQGLEDMGYSQAASVLSKESGFTLASQAAQDLQAAVLGGRWSEAVALLADVGVTADAPSHAEPGASSSRSSFTSGKDKATERETPLDRAKFLIAQQKYLEYLEAGQQKKALGVLRNELATSTQDSSALHDLSGYMMCLDRDDLYERAKWDGAAGISRRQLLERLQVDISPKVMVPSRRLASLLDQARQHQQQTCLYHDDNGLTSLYTDHQCVSGTFPKVTTHVLREHTDEVWRIEWSPNGNLLASASKDKTVAIWQLTPPEGESKKYGVVALHTLRGHNSSVDALSWSPDGETLVTAADRQVFVWNAKTGVRTSTSGENSPHTDTISAIQWLPDGSQFVVTSLDCHVVFYDATGNVVRKWAINNMHIVDFAITPDATRIVAVTTWRRRAPGSKKDEWRPTISARIVEGKDLSGEFESMDHGIAVIRIADRDMIDYVPNIQCSDATSLKLSHDGARVLVSCAPDELQLFGLEPHLHVIRKYVGHVQSRFLIRSSFGAPKDRFVMSGSEDNMVYVWQSNSTVPVEVLQGHEDTVNAVAWNPVLSRKLFASCSDDFSIRIWQPAEPVDQLPSARDEPDDTDEGMEL